MKSQGARLSSLDITSPLLLYLSMFLSSSYYLDSNTAGASSFLAPRRFFILFAISIVAVALVEVASYVVEKQEIMFKQTQV